MQSIVKPITIFYLSLGLITFSGFGVIFLNEETILAICFFIFLYIMIQNSDGVSQGLNQQKKTIKHELQIDLIEDQLNEVKLLLYKTDQKYELTLGFENVYNDSDFKISKAM